MLCLPVSSRCRIRIVDGESTWRIVYRTDKDAVIIAEVFQKELTQQQLASLIKSSQSRVAEMEAGDPTVSLDHLVKTLLALGASDRDLARAIAAR
jgi:predicted XRE-type DNA-binding protein